MNDLVLKAEITALGAIKSNADALLEMVRKNAEKYKDPAYEPDELTAKNDKALLNKQLKEIDAARLAIQREYMKPLDGFLATCKEIKEEANAAIEAVDRCVSEYEARRKKEKRERIAAMFPADTPVTLDQIFDPRWLNKSYKLTDINTEILAKSAAIDGDLKTLNQTIPAEDLAAVRTQYLTDLNIGNALNFARMLKEQREARAAQDAALAKREEQREETAEWVANAEAAHIAEVRKAVDEVMGETKPLYSYCFLIEDQPKEFWRDLKAFINSRGVSYTKINLDDYTPKF